MFFSNKKLVALDIGSSSVKLAEIDFTSRGPMLRKFAVSPLSANMVQGGEIVEPQAVGNIVRDLVAVSKCKRKNVVSGLWGNGVVVKKITMPKMEQKLISEQLKWEAEQYIPFGIDEVSLEYHVLGNRQLAENMEVLLVAAKQDYLFRLIEAVESADLNCAVVDVAGFALANCFELNYGAREKPVALVNIGGGVTNFVVVDRGEVIFCRDIAVGGSVYTSEIAKVMGVSPHEAESLKISASIGQEVPEEVNAIIRSTNDRVLDEIRNSIEFYSAASSGSPVTRFYFCGGSIYLPGLVEEISKANSIPYEIFDPFQRILYDTKVFPFDYIEQIKAISPVVLGLALRKADDK